MLQHVSTPPQVVVLSPHRDDAAFSCGLLLTRLLRAGASVHVVNVCTASDYAPYLPWPEEPRVSQVTAARLAEDQRFLAMLRAESGAEGHRCTMTDLGWQDGPLRLHIATERVLDTPERPDEVRSLAERFRPWCSADAVLAPLGFGNHVDHRLVRDAARAAFDAERLGLYEDLPYACWLDAGARVQRAGELLHGLALPALNAWNAPAQASMLPASSLKQRYASCYPSQIAADLAELMENDAAGMNGSERMHLPASAARLLQAVLDGTPPATTRT